MLWIWSRLILSTQTLAMLIIAIFCSTTDEDVLQTCEYSESSQQLRDLLGDFMKWLQEGIATLFYRFPRSVSFLGVRLSRTTGAPMKTLSSIFPITYPGIESLSTPTILLIQWQGYTPREQNRRGQIWRLLLKHDVASHVMTFRRTSMIGCGGNGEV